MLLLPKTIHKKCVNILTFLESRIKVNTTNSNIHFLFYCIN